MISGHPNIIQFYDMAHNEDYFLLFFQLQHASLRQYIDSHILLHELEAKCIMWQILHGIRYLHSLDIAHCDLKPENILLTFASSRPYPAICIADFDMAFYENTINDEYPGVCGTISYLPPEAILALDYKDLTYRRKSADRWSAGVVLFILLS
ncbi:kinase-like domain-containing protein, partial [Mycena olivaceomarginata]